MLAPLPDAHPTPGVAGRSPLALARAALVRAEHVVLVEVGPLAEITRPSQAQTSRVAEGPPRLRSPTAAPPHPHDVPAGTPPSRQEFRTAVEARVFTRA